VVNDRSPIIPVESTAEAVILDAERVKSLGIRVVRSGLVGEKTFGHHDSVRLAKAIMVWFLREKKTPKTPKTTPAETPPGVAGQVEDDPDLIDIEHSSELTEEFEEQPERRAQVV
jgi:hypothetical protein